MSEIDKNMSGEAAADDGTRHLPNNAGGFVLGDDLTAVPTNDSDASHS